MSLQVHKLLRLWDDLRVTELVASLSGDSEAPSRPVFGQMGLQWSKQSPGALLLQRIIAGKHQRNFYTLLHNVSHIYSCRCEHGKLIPEPRLRQWLSGQDSGLPLWPVQRHLSL